MSAITNFLLLMLLTLFSLYAFVPGFCVYNVGDDACCKFSSIIRMGGGVSGDRDIEDRNMRTNNCHEDRPSRREDFGLHCTGRDADDCKPVDVFEHVPDIR